MTTCLGIRHATHWADTRSIERISCSKGEHCYCWSRRLSRLAENVGPNDQFHAHAPMRPMQ